MERILEGLNEEQKQAVTTTDGPLLVVAGPGTGKTMTLVRRIAYLVEQGAKPSKILAVTFTNRAAREMRERADLFLGARARDVFIGTFHLLGLRMMRDNLGETFRVCSREEQMEILADLAGGRRTGEQAAGRISRVKSLMEEADDEVKAINSVYEQRLREQSLYDFDDLILTPLEMWESGTMKHDYGSAFRHIMIDEYQDINPAQYRLMRCLVGGENNICAVGDSDQAIYAFRGADVGNFLSFEEDFRGAAKVVLTNNYRSSRVIVGASSELVRHNLRRIDKDLHAVKGEGRKITVVSVPDENWEARTVVAEIEARMGGTSHYSLMRAGAGGPEGDEHGFRDFAVIYRTNAQARALEGAFLDSGIPFQVVKGNGPAGIKKVADSLQARIEKGLFCDGLAALADSLCDEAGVQDSDRAIVFQIVAAYADHEPERALPSILDELTLISSGDSFDPKVDKVALMTLHSAKGLEFKTVFITGVEDGLVPSAMAEHDPEREEERRLFYVGMTRAKDDLVLISARARFMYGERRFPNPSPFLAEIPEKFVEKKVIEKGPASRKQRQMKLF